MSKRCLGCKEYYGDEFEICPHCGYIEGTPAEEAIHMQPGTLLHDRYIVGRVLGFGGFGVTYIGWDGRLEQKVAIKEYLPSEFSTRMPGQSTVTVFNGEKEEQFRDGMVKFIDEAKRLAKFQNEHGIVKIFDSFFDNDTAYIIMEYLDGETLTERLEREKTIPEDEAVEMLWPVMKSLQAVHQEGILHRDIAPDNIFITKDGEVKLIDFGASRYATTSYSRSLTVIIKPGYSPEEQYRSRGDQGAYTDVYALAATLYKMITGVTPPDAMERRASIEGRKRELLEPPHKYVKKITLNRENAILNALNVRIEDRTSDVGSFMEELNADPPVKRRYGKIKRIDIYHWPIWLKILVPVVLAGIVTVGVLMAAGVINFASLFSDRVEVPDGVVIVPDVEGMDKEEAIRKLEENHLNASAEGNVVSDYIEAGKIVLQSPNGGSFMDEYSTVALTVSSGSGVQEAENGKAVVPYVIWDTEADAVSKLIQAGLAQPKIETKNDDTVEAGKVISQSVGYGKEVDEGTQITIVVSLGPAGFDMPDVTGDTLEEARSVLSSRGLNVSAGYEENNSVAEGRVIRQSIASGTKVRKGDSVTLTVSSGKTAITVPNVVGKSSSAAQSVLTSAGLKSNIIENYDTKIEKGYVISQTPSAGTQQTESAVITLYVSKGKQAVTVYFDPNEGSVDMGSKTVYVGSSYGSLPVPVNKKFNFVGWFTDPENGEKVTSDDIVTDSKAHTLYAHWSTVKMTVTFNPNGGRVSPGSATVYYDSTYGALPTPTRDYHVFAGWYTAKSGGSRVSGSTKVTKTSDHTIYAQWTEKEIKGWVRESEVPAGAQIVDSKWSYTLREYSESSSSSKSGWIKYDTMRTSWGPTQGPVYSDPSNGSRNVWSERYHSGYNKKSVDIYYRYYPSNNYYYSARASGWLTSSDGNSYNYTNYEEFRSDQYNITPSGSFYHVNFSNGGWVWAYYSRSEQVEDTNSPIYSTRWYYQEPVYTYYYYRDTDMESTYDPSGQSGVSSVVKYVKYREK